MDEERLKEIIANGKEASSWLNHPAFKHVICLRKAELISAFEKTKFDQQNERDEIWRKIQCLNSITQDFERIIRDASGAEKTLLEKIKNKFS